MNRVTAARWALRVCCALRAPTAVDHSRCTLSPHFDLFGVATFYTLVHVQLYPCQKSDLDVRSPIQQQDSNSCASIAQTACQRRAWRSRRRAGRSQQHRLPCAAACCGGHCRRRGCPAHSRSGPSPQWPLTVPARRPKTAHRWRGERQRLRLARARDLPATPRRSRWG